MSDALFVRGDDPRGVRFIDARSGPDARAAFEAQHLCGARWFDLETELSSKGDPAHGGRHPLPSTRAFVSLLEAHGIHADDDIVCYDDKSGANAAARLWWMLRAIGHRRVRVLDGGLAAAIADGLATESGPMPSVAKSAYSLASSHARALEDGTPSHPIVSLDAVKRALASRTHVVIDVRDGDRYRGEREPIDPIAGRIAGAINVALTENLQPDGRFSSPDALRSLYQRVWREHGLSWPDASAVIVHCGSGVTACHTLVAFAHGGIDGAALYVGSYSEWCRREPIAKG